LKQNAKKVKSCLKLADNFLQCSLGIKKKYLIDLNTKLKKLKAFDTWDVDVNFEEMFDEIIDNQRKLSLAEKQQEHVDKILRILEDIFLSNLRFISNTFWHEFNIEYIQAMNLNMSSLKVYLQENYNMQPDEFEEYLKSIEEEIYTNFKKDIVKEKVPELFNFAVNNFKKDFLYEDAMPRIWNKISESEISFLYKELKQKHSIIFDIFRYFNLVRSPMSGK
jgi:hypothetical protein